MVILTNSGRFDLTQYGINFLTLSKIKQMDRRYLMPTQEAGREFIMKQIQGSVVMLNLLRFREIEVADYSETPDGVIQTISNQSN